MKVSLVILSSRQPELLEQCLHAAWFKGCAWERIVVVDNPAEDETKDLCGGCDYLPFDRELGTAEAANVGLRHCWGSDYALVIAQDVLLKRNTVPAFARHEERNTFQQGSLNGIARRRMSHNRLTLLAASREVCGVVDCEYCHGGLLWVPGDYIRWNHSLYDCRLWSYCEDWDLALRARVGGWRTQYNPYAEADHLGANTFDERIGDRLYYLVRNTAIVAKRHHFGFYPLNRWIWLFFVSRVIAEKYPAHRCRIRQAVRDALSFRDETYCSHKPQLW